MKPLLQIAAVALFAWSGLASGAAAQDKAPPGCRWQGYQGDTVLACKDARGYWRRSGDDEIVGYDPPKKPKPKPAPMATSATPAPAAAVPAPPVPEAAAPSVPAPPPPGEVVHDPTQPPVTAAPAEPPAAPIPPPAPPQPPAPKPWWEGLWASVWKAILGFLKMVGLLH